VKDTTPTPGIEPAGEQTQGAAASIHRGASQILRVPKIWMIPLILAARFISLMATSYIGREPSAPPAGERPGCR
jgi:hypothetical protein